jgi:L-asparaginase
MLIDPDTGRRRPALLGEQLAAAVPGLSVELLHRQPYKIASHEATFEHWCRLAEAVAEARKEADGVVVIHGTDTMEEAAFFLAETLANPTVAMLGAMRPSGHLGEDGLRNVRDAIDVATSPVRTGVTVVMNRELLPAWDVVKADTVAFNAFGTRHGTRIGTVHDRDVRLTSVPVRCNWLGEIPPNPPSPDDVAMVSLTASPSAKRVATAMTGARAIVVEALATGSIPSSVRREVLAAAADVPVVVTTRCSSGPVRDEEDYPHAWDDLDAAGIEIDDLLDAPKARIRLALSLSLGRAYLPFATAS